MEQSPPIDVFEEIMLEDTANNMVGFFAEGVRAGEGDWYELGVDNKGDYLWSWASTEKHTLYKQYKGWVVSGNKPRYLNNKWLVMGFQPSIFYAYFGDRTVDRIKLVDSTFIINNSIKIKTDIINVMEVLTDTKETSFIINDKQIKRLITKSEAPIDIQLKFFFPVIELSDYLLQNYDPINSLNKFIKRTKYFLTVSPVKHFIFKIQNKELITLNKLPIDEHYKETIKSLIFASHNNLVLKDNYFVYSKNLKSVYFGIAYIFPEKIKKEDLNDLQKQISDIEVYILSILERL